MPIWYILVGLSGLCVGSFLNVLIDRLPKGEKITGRSYCPYCKKKLAWYELIPLFSFVALFGKCSSCKKPISIQYPLVEFTTGILFVLTTYNYNLQLTTSNLSLLGVVSCLLLVVFLLFIVSCLIVIFVTDLKYYTVPDEIIYSGVFSALFYQIISNFQSTNYNIQHLLSIMKLPVLSAVGAVAFFLLIILLTKGKGMGIGDVKISAFMGLLLSFPNILVALFLAFFFGSVVGLILIAIKKKKLKSEIPFGCFLASATYIAFFFGGKIIEWYPI